MFVKNTGPKVLGFGKLALTPGASDTLPAGYNEKHPTVQFYIEKGWLTPTVAAAPTQTGPTADELAAQKAEQDRLAAEAKRKADEAAEQARKDAELAAQKLAAQKAEELDKKLKEVAKMNLDPLKAEATLLGIEFPADATKAVLVELITKKLTAE